MISTGGTTTLGLYDSKSDIIRLRQDLDYLDSVKLDIGSYGLGSNTGKILFPQTIAEYFLTLSGSTQTARNHNAALSYALPTHSAGIYTQVSDTFTYLTAAYSGNQAVIIAGVAATQEQAIYNLWHSRNSTVDANGFIKAASPIVQLYADRIELNEDAKKQAIEFEKLGTGDYLIKNSTGLAQEGWYVEQPKDANGNVYHAVIYEQLENGDLSVKTYEQKLEGTRIVADLTKPVDVKENRFISIRLNELPKDDTAPLNPTIVDNEGNAAPSKYHTLENGTWVISEVDSEKLEADKHKAYMDSLKPLTRRQFMRVLVLNGYDLDMIEAQIQAIEDAQTRQLALIDWKESTEFRRNDKTLLMMAGLLGLSEDQINSMWKVAQQY